VENTNRSKIIKFSLFTDYFQYQCPEEISKNGVADIMKGMMR
jgi:hypothetical protein